MRKHCKDARMYKGLPLVDATRDMELRVTKNDVKFAKKNDPRNCAAAVCISRIMKTEAEVHISRTYIKADNKWIRFITPPAIGREITSFDRSAIFESGDYTLKAPPQSQKLGYGRGKGGHVRTETGKKHRVNHMTTNIRERAK